MLLWFYCQVSLLKPRWPQLPPRSLRFLHFTFRSMIHAEWICERCQVCVSLCFALHFLQRALWKSPSSPQEIASTRFSRLSWPSFCGSSPGLCSSVAVLVCSRTNGLSSCRLQLSRVSKSGSVCATPWFPSLLCRLLLCLVFYVNFRITSSASTE